MYFDGSVFHQRVVGKSHQFTYPYPAELFSNIYDFNGEEFTIAFLESFPRFTDSIHPGLIDHFKECKNIFHGDLKDIQIDFLGLPNNSYFNRFNPVRFFFISHKETCIGLLADVTNTFKEKRSYFIHDHGNSIQNTRLTSIKDMYVSPFNKKNGSYEFECDYSKQNLRININQYYAGELIVRTKLWGSILPKKSFLQRMKFFFSCLLVIPRIHWHALLLFVKKHSIYPHGESGYHNENS